MLFDLLIAIVVLGLIVWAVNAFIPMDARFKQLFNIVIGIFLVLWLIGILTGQAPGPWSLGHGWRRP